MEMHLEEAESTLEILLPREQLSELDVEAIERVLTEIERLRRELAELAVYDASQHTGYGWAVDAINAMKKKAAKAGGERWT